MTGIYLPPILSRLGVQFVGMEDIPGGGTRIVFSTPDGHDRVALVKVSIVSMSKLRYTYAIYDEETSTFLYYEGPHGDPTQDRLMEIDSGGP